MGENAFIVEAGLFYRIVLIVAVICFVSMAFTLTIAVRLAKSRKTLQSIAYGDPVTDGGNQAWFEMEAQKLLRQNPSTDYAMVYADLEQFKIINDSFGRNAGDRVLRYVYDKLQSCLGTGELVARLSADHFGLLLACSDPEMIEARLIDAATLINDFNFQTNDKYFLMMAFGVFSVQGRSLDFYSIQDRARVACLNAKMLEGSGLGRCAFFQEEDRKRLVREKEIENRIDNALENREFIVYLQPKCELEHHSVVGAEALVRWNDPKNGMIPPADFIYLFERDGFVVALDVYVFEEVCRLQRDWIDRGITPVPISINLSRVHLKNPAFLERYEEIRQKYQVPANLLELELTETIVYDDTERLVQAIDEMHRLGYRCSLDDFGSGYSSLNTLRAIPVDILKLDREFFQGDPSNAARGEQVVRGVIELAHRLGMKTVAEGVEEISQVELLRDAGCDMIQGFVFYRPIPPDQFEQKAFVAQH